MESIFNRLKTTLRSSFITCNSGGENGYNVMIQVKTLKEVHELHREIIEFTKLKGKQQ